MSCNGNVLLTKNQPFNKDKSYAEDGDAVHWMIEQVFSGQNSAEHYIGKQAPNGVFITAEMVEHAHKYLHDITGKGFIEHETNIKTEKWEVRGRVDHIEYRTDLHDTLIVRDYKNGWGIVEPKQNWTLISHAISFVMQNMICPDEISFMIYQPKASHPEGPVRTWTIGYAELLELYNQLNQAMSNPSNQLATGEHCHRCPSMANCPANRIALCNAVDIAEEAFNADVNNDELKYILDNIKRASDIISQSEQAYKDLAMHRLKQGERIPFYNLDKSYGHTTWNKGVTPEFIEMLSGINCTESKLVTPAAAKRLGVSEDIVKSITERPQNSFKLVRVDKSEKAEKLFGKK